MGRSAQGFLFRPSVQALRTLIPVRDSFFIGANKNCVISQVEPPGLLDGLRRLLFHFGSVPFNLLLHLLHAELQSIFALSQCLFSLVLLCFGPASGFSEGNDDTGEKNKCYETECLRAIERGVLRGKKPEPQSER